MGIARGGEGRIKRPNPFLREKKLGIRKSRGKELWAPGRTETQGSSFRGEKKANLGAPPIPKEKLNEGEASRK